MKYKICYYYDPNNFAFSGIGFVPPIRGDYPLPDFSTWQATDYKDGFTSFWVGNEWVDVEDENLNEATADPIGEQGDD